MTLDEAEAAMRELAEQHEGLVVDQPPQMEPVRLRVACKSRLYATATEQGWRLYDSWLFYAMDANPKATFPLGAETALVAAMVLLDSQQPMTTGVDMREIEQRVVRKWMGFGRHGEQWLYGDDDERE